MSAKDIAVRFFTGLNQHDLDQAFAGFSEDVVYHGFSERDGVLSRTDYVGKEQLRGYLGTFLSTTAGEYLHYDLRTVQGDERFVAVEWVDLARSGSGKEYRNQGVNVFEFDDAGRVKDVRAYMDWTPLAGWGWTPPEAG